VRTTVSSGVLYCGNVQGVGFRFTARRIAARFPVTGFVENLADGRVRVVVEGEAPHIEGFLAAVQDALGSYIDGVEQTAGTPTGTWGTFSIRH
jgi:acylphosphatase